MKNAFKSKGIILLIFFALANTTLAASGEQDQKFRRILTMTMDDLTEEAQELLDQRYPDEDWDQYDFPQYVYTNDSVKTGYMIAVKEPELLKHFKCYCFCDVMGHADLRWCFLKEGELEKGFDPHGAGCNICYRQAIMALLWQEAGIEPERMIQGFEKKYKDLIERFGEQRTTLDHIWYAVKMSLRVC